MTPEKLKKFFKYCTGYEIDVIIRSNIKYISLWTSKRNIPTKLIINKSDLKLPEAKLKACILHEAGHLICGQDEFLAHKWAIETAKNRGWNQIWYYLILQSYDFLEGFKKYPVRFKRHKDIYYKARKEGILNKKTDHIYKEHTKRILKIKKSIAYLESIEKNLTRRILKIIEKLNSLETELKRIKKEN